MSTVARLSDWNVDELIILDISPQDLHDLRRDDLHQSYEGSSSLDVLEAIAKHCQMPLTFGGRIRTLDDIEQRLVRGADKVSINTQAIIEPLFVEAAAKRFGEQCIVCSVDVSVTPHGPRVVFRGRKEMTDVDPIRWSQQLSDLGAGEILLNSTDRDGTGVGYDVELSNAVAQAVPIPVILCGGVGQFEHFPEGFLKGSASALAAANIFHFRELSYIRAKTTCIEAGLPMRPNELGLALGSREPHYDKEREQIRLESRLTKAADFRNGKGPNTSEPTSGSVTWCTQCVYPTISAAPMEFDESGVCTGCQMSAAKTAIVDAEWQRRRQLLHELIDQYRDVEGRRYDCVVAVSGGKDSYFQVHIIKNELGLNPLLVTYDGNNWTEVGWRNLLRMREAFDVDHVLVRPSVSTLRKLNKAAFYVMGDMNWHAHVGIMTVPMSEATSRGIPLVFYGEHGYMDLSGQFNMNDFPEVTFRDRLEHFARGYEWTYFVGMDGLTERDLLTWRYPSDEDIDRLDLRGIFLGNYVYWEANEHIELVTERYGFEINEEPFDRTYRLMSNLDDMHENGVHDYLKYIKFGYGRATDHVSKDIRAGLMTRAEGIGKVKAYDHVKPRDLQRWLEYVGMDESEFDSVADTFRDSRVWRYSDDQWLRNEIS